MPTTINIERAMSDVASAVANLHPGAVTVPGGAYVSISEGAATLAAWAGPAMVSIPLTAVQADALAAQLVDRSAEARAVVLADAGLCNPSFDLRRTLE